MPSRSRRNALLFSLLATTALAAASARAAAGAPAPLLAGPTNDAKTITFAVALPAADPAGAAAFVRHVSTPGDPLFHHFLTPAQYADRFGTTAADYAAAIAWAQSHGLTVGERYAGRGVVPVTGSAGAVGRALGVGFADYRDAATGRLFSAATGTARAPALPSGRPASVLGLNGRFDYVPYVRPLPAGSKGLAEGTGPGGGFSAADIRTTYSIPAQAFANAGQTIALFEQGGYDPKDVATYLKTNKLPAVTVTPRSVNGYGTAIDNNNVELEAVLDIDMAIATNPALGNVVVYEDGSDPFPVALLDSLSAIASDNKARTVSISYGQDETLQGATAIAAENTVLTEMAAQGQAVFASSGDNGAYGDSSLPENVADPSSQPFVTGVGGSTLFTGANEKYLGEESWDELSLGDGGTGGGISTVWPIPSYQLVQGQSVGTLNGGSATMRNVPDVAAVANPLTGVAIYSALNGGWLTIGGTSVSAPIWASFYSLVDNATEALGLGRAGFANPNLYNLSQTALIAYPLLHDILDGGNGAPNDGGARGFFAGYGYDNCTGLGSMNGATLLLNLALLPAVAGTNPPPTPRGLTETAAATTANLSWTATKGATGYAVIVYLDDGFNDFVPPVLTKANKLTVTGLSPNTVYEYTVLAISPGGASESAFDIFTTKKKG